MVIDCYGKIYNPLGRAFYIFEEKHNTILKKQRWTLSKYNLTYQIRMENK